MGRGGFARPFTARKPAPGGMAAVFAGLTGGVPGGIFCIFIF